MANDWRTSHWINEIGAGLAQERRWINKVSTGLVKPPKDWRDCRRIKKFGEELKLAHVWQNWHWFCEIGVGLANLAQDQQGWQ